MLQAYADAFGVALAERGWARGPVDSAGVAAFAGQAQHWQSLEGPGYALEKASVDERALAAALGAASAMFVRHRPGSHGLPPLGEGVGFVLDLNDGWPSPDGGLLLFQDGDRMSGFRPERGLITVFDTARPPLLTLVGPHAADRYAVIGRLA